MNVAARGAAALLALQLTSHALAQAPRRALTLDSAVAIALRQSPDLGIARATVDSARAEVRIARALPNPSYAASPNSPYQHSLTLPLDVGPQRTFRGRAGVLGAEAARDDARDAERQVTLAVRRAFYDVLLADERRRLVGDRRDVVRQLFVADSVRVRAGDIPERNLARSEVELARADADLARADVDARAARLALQAAMGVARPDPALALDGTLAYRCDDAPHDSLADDSLASDSLVAAAMRRRADVAAGEARVSQSAQLRRLAAASLVPVPQLSYVRQFGTPFDSRHFYAFGVSLEVPLLDQYAGQRERAAAAASAADIARRRTTLQVRRDVDAALDAFRAQRTLVQRYAAGLLTKVDANVAAARYAYERGATSLLDVLDATRARQDVLTDYYTALHDYWTSVAALDAAVGGGAFGTTR